jgi:glycosyltransferase involved in cell wall biosynthesis
MGKEYRIGVDVSRIYRGDRGIPIYTRNILQQFGKFVHDAEFTLLHYPENKPETDFGLSTPNFREIPYSGKYVPWLRLYQEQVLYPKFQQGLDVDVLWHPQNHGQYETPVGYVVTLHDIFPMVRPELAEALDVADIDKKVLSDARIKSIVGADAVITVSQFSKGEITANVEVDPTRVHVVHNGIDTNVFYPGKLDPNVRDKFNLPKSYILTVGSYAPHKNLKSLILAYQDSCLPSSGVDLVLVGPQDGAVFRTNIDELNKLKESIPLKNRIHMLPSVTLQELASIYRGADIFAITSIYEGFGFPPLEAMASGIPVVTSNTTSLPEVCGEAALYASPYDLHEISQQFNRIYVDNKLREEMISRGLAQIQSFTWENAARQTYKVLTDVSRRRRGL